MKKTFTLIELLIVIIIAGILLSSATIAYRKALIRQRETNAQGTLGIILEAEKDYYNFKATGGKYTSYWTQLDIDDPSRRDHIYDYCVWTAPLCIEAFIPPNSDITGYREFHINADGLDSDGKATLGRCPGKAGFCPESKE